MHRRRSVAVPTEAPRAVSGRSAADRAPAAMTPADDARRRRAARDRRILDALRLGGDAEVIAAALGISPHLVRRIAHEARKQGRPDAVPPRKPYRRAKGPPPEAGRD